MFGRDKPQPSVEIEEVRPLIVTPTDAVVLRMASVADRIKAMDEGIAVLFEEWRSVQSECIRVGIQVDVLKSPWLEAAYMAHTSHRSARPASSESLTTHDGWAVVDDQVKPTDESAHYARNGD